jgi:ligand-binding sensor protein
LKLSDVISLDTLQEIQDLFTQATGFAAIVVDMQGNPLIKFSSFTNYCVKLREDEVFNNKCRQSDAHSGLEALRNGELCIHRCHGGLIDFAVPIVVDGEFLATFMCGQVKSPDFGDAETRLIQQNDDIFKDRPDLRELYDEIIVVPAWRVVATANLLKAIVDSIVRQYTLRRQNAQMEEEQRGQTALKKINDDLEIRLHQSQVRPHFIFNALNTAARQARLEGARKTEDMLYALADMYRHSMKHSAPLATVEEELQNLKNYIFIQKARFGDLLSFEAEVAPDAMGCDLPVMSLQVLVENAMRHGLEKKNHLGYVKVFGGKKNDRLFFEVTDNGTGMTRERMTQLNDIEGVLRKTNAMQGTGIYNLYKRLSHFFKGDFKAVFAENPGGGVTARLEFPALRTSQTA